MRLRYQFELIQLIRNYFTQQGFLDVITPPAVENPGMEVHIHPFQLYSVQNSKNRPFYLHSSPEFALKGILASDDNFENIFSLSYCFRDEPSSPLHRFQFIMLEWYRKHERYEKIMEDVEGLVTFCTQHMKLPLRPSLRNPSMVKMTMQEIFKNFLNIDILNYLDIPSIKNLLVQFPDVPVPEQELEWDDYFFLLYLNKIEPELSKYPLLLIYEFPAPLAALSTLKESDPRVCERFEVYINGIELCNAFNELTDLEEQKARFKTQNELKKKLYGYDLPEPLKFYAAMEKGLPACSGIALGVERLLTSLFEIDNPFFE